MASFGGIGLTSGRLAISSHGLAFPLQKAPVCPILGWFLGNLVASNLTLPPSLDCGPEVGTRPLSPPLGFLGLLPPFFPACLMVTGHVSKTMHPVYTSASLPQYNSRLQGPPSLSFKEENQSMFFFTSITSPPKWWPLTPLQPFVCDVRGKDEIWQGVGGGLAGTIFSKGKPPKHFPGMPPYHLALLLPKEEGQRMVTLMINDTASRGASNSS